MAVRVNLVLKEPRTGTPERVASVTPAVMVRRMSVSEDAGKGRGAHPPGKPKSGFLCDQKMPGQ